MRFRVGVLFALGLTILGCGPPQIAPMTPPGVALPKVINEDEESDAIGETKNRAMTAPPTPPGPAKPDAPIPAKP